MRGKKKVLNREEREHVDLLKHKQTNPPLEHSPLLLPIIFQPGLAQGRDKGRVLRRKHTGFKISRN